MYAKKNPNVPVAVFDISSGSVGGAHALIRKGDASDTNKVLLLSQKRFNSALQEELTIDRFIDDTLKNIESVASTLQKQSPHHIPEFVQIVLASPWYSSQTRHIFYEKNTEFTCTEKLIKEIVAKEINHILIHDKESFGDLDQEYTIVEKEISKIKINGYSTNSPFGKKAKNIELYLTITVAPKSILDSFKNRIQRIYSLKNIYITTSAYTSYIAMRENAPTESNCVIIDVGEEITDVAFVKNDIFLHQYSFPVGTYELYRAVVENTDSTYEESLALLEAYKRGDLSSKISSKINDSLIKFIESWQEQIRKIIDIGDYGFIIPKDWYIVIDRNFEYLIKNQLEQDEYLKYKANTKIKPDIITEDEINLFVKSIDIELDIPLALGLIFAEKIV